MYSGLSCKKQYLLQVTDRSLQMFGDTRIKAACNRTGCIFAVRNRVLTRKLRRIQAMRFCIFEIQGPSEVEVEKCNRLIEKYFPDYKLRKPYSDKEPAVRLKISQSTPDNTNLYFVRQRYGLGRTQIGDLQRTSADTAADTLTSNSLAALLGGSSDWTERRFRDSDTSSSSARRSISQGPLRHRVSFDEAASTSACGDTTDGETSGISSHRPGISISEKEAALRQEMSRLESHLSNLQLV